MSYDLEILGKIENEQYICIEPKVIIDNGWFENPRSNSKPEHRDPYEFVFSPYWKDPDDYNRM